MPARHRRGQHREGAKEQPRPAPVQHPLASPRRCGRKLRIGVRLTSQGRSADQSDGIRWFPRPVEDDLIMPDQQRGTGRAERRAKRFLSPSQKYEVFIQLVRQEMTMAEAAVTGRWTEGPSCASARWSRRAPSRPCPAPVPVPRPRNGTSSWRRPEPTPPAWARRSRRWRSSSWWSRERSLGLSGRVPGRVATMPPRRACWICSRRPPTPTGAGGERAENWSSARCGPTAGPAATPPPACSTTRWRPSWPLPRVGRGRPLPSQAGASGLLYRVGLGRPLEGPARPCCSGLNLHAPTRPGRSVRTPFPDWVEYRLNSIWIYDTERHEALLKLAVMKGHVAHLVGV